IHLEAVTGGDRGANRAHSVFDRTMRGVMQGAMGDRPRREPIQRGRHIERRHFWAVPDQETSNKPSTSTAASAGSAATPTVDRACLPFSPNTATMRSEAPFITFGPSPKPTAEFMNPPSRTTRT